MGLFGLFKKKKKDTKQDEIKTPKIEETKISTQNKGTENAEKQIITEKEPIKTPVNDTNDSTNINVNKINNSDKTDKTVSQHKNNKKVPNTQKTEKKSTTAAETKNAVKSETKPDQNATKPEPKADTKVVTKPEDEAEATSPESSEVDSKNYTGRFEINKSKDGKKFFFNLYASNKVGIATSQMYSTAQNALNGVKSVIANAAKAPIEDQSLKKYEVLPFPKWEIYIDNGGKYRFRLSASNGNCVCHSQGYTTKTACKNGIDSIIRSSRNAEIDKTYITNK